ncbi:MFS transporter [Pajaroellobacter abortibovis]|uniref:Major facilitator superfamily (MFS) profile domain-containing protein n=1 Tax=Pajaroellobacter abortibovis TaxID=1882918 RepID=A0A1L6MXQ0_9BACT|nr:MFS transporter [Pajaroellobacter abortibovis]APS00371.1 hypothetical protein BCY86_06525 [Pajaroellobacter abortibovis]
MSSSLARTLITSMIGNLFEWYDFALFGYLAPYIGKLFFPSSDPMSETILALGVFATGFIVRPLGGLLFGYIGDRCGRKKAMLATILLMALPMALIGMLPTYATLGITASVLLIIMRMLQGISMGGNYGGSITFTTEHFVRQHQGLVGSFTAISCLTGIMLGSATAALLSFVFKEEELLRWGWRVPFLLGITICGVGFYMRRQVTESPVYLKEVASGQISQRPPAAEVFLNHGKTLWTLVFVVMLHDLSFYVLLLYMITHLIQIIGMDEQAAFTINTTNLFTASVATCFAGWLSDKVGRKPVLIGAALMFLVGTFPLMHLMFSSQNVGLVFFAQFILAITVGCYFGPLPALMVESFPTKVRYSAIAITTNISGPLFGGTAPMLVAYLVTKTGSKMIPAYYLMLGSVFSLLALRSLKLYTSPTPTSSSTPVFDSYSIDNKSLS